MQLLTLATGNVLQGFFNLLKVEEFFPPTAHGQRYIAWLLAVRSRNARDVSYVTAIKKEVTAKRAHQWRTDTPKQASSCMALKQHK